MNPAAGFTLRRTIHLSIIRSKLRGIADESSEYAGNDVVREFTSFLVERATGVKMYIGISSMIEEDRHLMVQIYVNVKSLAKKRNYVEKKEITLNNLPQTLRELIVEFVRMNVQQFNHKEPEVPLLNYLTKSDVELQSMTGKIGFQTKYNENQTDPDEAVETAIQAFQDGLYRVFIHEDELEELDHPITIQDGDEITFIRLTMLAGRMW